MSVFQSDLEEQYQKLTVDNVRVEAELKHEKQKVEMLQRDLQDSQKVSPLLVINTYDTTCLLVDS